jgi:AT-rich interactive domain-containing protein 1
MMLIFVVTGSSNSQDSFPPPGSGSASMDGYGYGGYPPGPGSTPDYGSPPMQQQQRPASQSNAPSPHPGELNFTLGHMLYSCAV